jgi:hypothetical protein
MAGNDFEAFDKLHYEVENKLLHLIGSLESKRGTDQWQDSLPDPSKNPATHSSQYPSTRAPSKPARP